MYAIRSYYDLVGGFAPLPHLLKDGFGNFSGDGVIFYPLQQTGQQFR